MSKRLGQDKTYKIKKNGHGWPDKQWSIYDFDRQTINDTPILEMDDKLVHIVPDGYMAVCHICNPPRPLTKEQNETHDRDVHNIKR